MFCLSFSANLSKAAWGSLNKAGDRLQIKSYEAGVLFLPKFITGKEVFDLKSHEPEYRFYLPYDLPLKKFGPKDSPWLYDYLREDLK
jgi:tyrosyl-DNA phosphodiesterase-1